MLTKNHISHGAECFADGNILWDDTKTPMIVPASAETLQDHVNNGMYMLVLSPRALEEDQAHSMPGHEMSLHIKLKAEVQAATVPEGSALFDTVSGNVMLATGGRWTKETPPTPTTSSWLWTRTLSRSWWISIFNSSIQVC